ncbi:MAG TPA: hypothetical protein PKV98_15015 [Burkholderiaceae bacterium]|nr:hypothetical protein [Burkholderiaceae bacterium]
MGWNIVYKEPPATSFATLFESTENPLSEGGAWVKAGSAWQTVRSLNSYACGAAYTDAEDDAYVKLSSSTFAAPNDDYEVVATVRHVNDQLAVQEIEILLRVVDTSTTINCYEVLVATNGSITLVRWNGIPHNGEYLILDSTTSNPASWSGNGDKIKARVTGTNPVVVNVWHAPSSNPTNFTQLSGFPYSDTDATRKQSGQPGIAFYQHAADNNLLNAGWQDFTVTSV